MKRQRKRDRGRETDKVWICILPIDLLREAGVDSQRNHLASHIHPLGGPARSSGGPSGPPLCLTVAIDTQERQRHPAVCTLNLETTRRYRGRRERDRYPIQSPASKHRQQRQPMAARRRQLISNTREATNGERQEREGYRDRRERRV